MAVKRVKKQTRGIQKQKWRPKLKNKDISKVEKSVIVNPKQKKTLVIAQEIKFARALACNDKKARVKMLKNLRSWLTVRSKSSFEFTEPEFMRLWKGLYYCMWLSDKPLVQEELAESISHLIFCFESLNVVLLYTACSLKTLSMEWFGIDHYRMDKFQMLVRRIIRQTFVMCKKQLWAEEWIKGIANVIEIMLLDSKGSLGFKFHVTEVYMEELAKVSGGKIAEDTVTELLRPFAIYLATMTDGRQISHVTKFVFRYLIFQSDVGIEYMEKFKAWKEAGFPTGSIDAMQKIELSDAEDEEIVDEEESHDDLKKNQPLDPRAGSVHVDLPQVPFNPQQISKLIQQYKFHPSSTKKNRRQVTKLINEFNELAKGNMPLGIKEIRIPSAKSPDTNPKVAAKRLIEFQDQLHADSYRHLNRKKKKKLLAMDDGDDGDENANDSSGKKQKLAPEIIDKSDSDDENDKDTRVNQDVESKISKTVIQLNQLQDSPKKNMKLQNKNSKVTKLQKIKGNKKRELFDGIEDFENFKNTVQTLGKKKTLKPNHDDSWEVSSSECTPIKSISENVKHPSSSPTIPIVEKLKEKKSDLSKKKPVKKIPSLCPVVKKLENETLIQQASKKSSFPQNIESNMKKRVKIVLQRNTSQATSEYFRQLRLSPAIPYDANKKPRAGVLKSTPLSSPINPFYKKM